MTTLLGPLPFIGMLGTVYSLQSRIIPDYHRPFPPAPGGNPLLDLGGGEDEQFDEHFGYFVVPSEGDEFEEGIGWELGGASSAYGIGPVPLGSFTTHALSEAKRHRAEAMRSVLAAVEGQTRRLVKVTLPTGGQTHVQWRTIDFKP